MLRHLLRSAAYTVLLAAAASASASPLILSASLPAGQRLADVTLYNMFDAGNQLPADARIRSASFVFDFTDDSDDYAWHIERTGGSATPYALTGTRSDRGELEYFYTRQVVEYYDERHDYEQESASVHIGGTSVAAATALVQSTSVDQQRTTQQFATSPEPGRIDWYTSEMLAEYTISRNDWTGPFSLRGNISDRGALDALLRMNSMPFVLEVRGDLQLAGARLVLDVAEPGEPLPEPSTAWLALAGAAGMLLRRRRA